jgi:uncharacterized protein YjhX (UPF0386 family)
MHEKAQRAAHRLARLGRIQHRLENVDGLTRVAAA